MPSAQRLTPKSPKGDLFPYKVAFIPNAQLVFFKYGLRPYFQVMVNSHFE
jgi:hypothetical protein